MVKPKLKNLLTKIKKKPDPYLIQNQNFILNSTFNLSLTLYLSLALTL